MIFFVRFGFYQKKVTKPVFLKKSKPVLFSYFRTKPVQSPVPIWLIFSSLTRFFPGIFWLFSVWVRFNLVFWVSGL